MWIQTLPITAQLNILSFLMALNTMFHAKDLESLANRLLSGTQTNFWMTKAAENLLSQLGKFNKPTKDNDTVAPLPGWLLKNKEQSTPFLPWLPVKTVIHNHDMRKAISETAIETEKTRLERLPCKDAEDDLCLHTPENKRESKQQIQDYVIGLNTPPKIQNSEPEEAPTNVVGEKGVVTEGPPSNNLLHDRERNVIPEPPPTNDPELESEMKAGSKECKASISCETYELVQSLRQSWLDRQPISSDVDSLRMSPELVQLLKLLKPWEIEDDVVLSTFEIFITKDCGYNWAVQILAYFVLPKLLQLQQPASRFLSASIMHAAKVHPRAAVDAVLVPSVLCGIGPNKAQCDAINRAIKECLPDNHALSLLSKLLVERRRQRFAFELTDSFLIPEFYNNKLILSEDTCLMLQNILSRKLSLDEEVLDGLISLCNEGSEHLSNSLKFSNLLLCLISRHSPNLKAYKTTIQRIAENVKTFIGKSLLSKTLAL